MDELKLTGTPFSTTYKRTTSRPMDSSEIFETIDAATMYAQNANKTYVPYPGQIISVKGGEVYKLLIDPEMPDDSAKGFYHCKLDIIGGNISNDNRYLRKDQEDTAQKIIHFREGIDAKKVSTLEQIVLLEDIASKNFTPGSTGFGIKEDEVGNYHLDIDFVNIRRKLTADEIQVQRSYYVGGKQWVTPGAGIVCTSVEDTGSVYRCHFKTTDADGREVKCLFQSDDWAICETFNLEKKVGGTLGNHYYWRLVVGVGTDYIDLSKSNAGPGSDTPMPGDEIVQLGNKSDTSRQGAICSDAITTGGPYIRVYKGIIDYHLPQPKIDLNPDKSTIIAKLISEATGKDVDTILGEIQGSLDIIKGQTDKEYTMWFYDYAPTLSNIPASEWTTDDLRIMHEQDMFYNRKSGLAYRFEKSGNTWAWNNITDLQTIKALEDAARAQDTADGKRRTFVAQPTDSQAYDVGDLWVNVMYSDANVSYKNDVLVCKTAKAKGVAFSISHWEPTSTATTAYIENLGNQIVIAVTDSDEGIEAAKKLANQGIKDASDAAKSAAEALGIAQGAKSVAVENTSAIQVTKESIALLAQGIHFDASGKITNINTSGLVTTDDFNTLLSKKVNFDSGGHITNISTSGLVTEAGFVKMFDARADANGYVKSGEISLFITEDDTKRLISNAVILADQITLEGIVTANDYFRILEDGSMEVNKGTFKGDLIQGNGINRMNADGSVSFANGKISWGVEGNPLIEGKLTTSLNGTRIEINPESSSIKMYNQNDKEVGRISFITEEWNGSSNYYPRIRLNNYHGDEQTSDMMISGSNISMSVNMGNNNYFCHLEPRVGLRFYKNDVLTKEYPAS
ncbi:MAG: hypothetical protein EGQ20_15125 [Bacteroides oleiciplenus]|nr:hypothetical protein [Bacteroides oleiciplenus]